MEHRDVVLGGKGQVGSALCAVLGGLAVDKGDDGVIGKCEYLHVCIPYHEVSFLLAVEDAIKRFKPEVVVIHSTVPVGTTGRINNAVHSPVRGQHDDLEGSLRRFVKYVGGIDVLRARVVDRLIEAGIPARGMGGSRDTELMKMLCLSRYLNEIAFYQVADQLCRKFGVDRENMKDWTLTYNSGYEGTRWKRSTLEFPGGEVGGHCVGPVSRMLYEQTRDYWLRVNLSMFNLI